MSYCRFTNARSEAYVIGSATALECIGCRITGDPDRTGVRRGLYVTTSRTALIVHLQRHRQLRFLVPFAATRRLKRERHLHGDAYTPKEFS